MTTEIQTIQNLLTQVSAIRNKYEEMARILGENFNVFRILGLSSNEVRTHSAFIAELLNPKGSHGQGDVFLKLFLKELKIEEGFVDTTSVSVFVEAFAGYITQNYDEGGRIDILLVDKNNIGIIIENKIYAGDQYKQLERYDNYAQKNLKNYQIYYLTLEGKTSTEDLPIASYKCISYENNIINWLSECKKEAVNQPLLRETITQYINLIKILTHQTLNQKMKEEYLSLFFDEKGDMKKENIRAFYQLNNLNLEVLILEKFKQILFSELSEFENISHSLFGNKDSFIGFRKPNSNLNILLYFADSKKHDLYIGVHENFIEGGIVKPELRIKLNQILKNNITDLKDINLQNWYWYAYLNKYNSTEWEDLLEIDSIKYYVGKIRQISNLIYN